MKMKHHLLVILAIIVTSGKYEENEGANRCSPSIEQSEHSYGHTAKWVNEAGQLQKFTFKDELPKNISNYIEILYLKSTEYKTVLVEKRKKSLAELEKLNSLTLLVNVILLVALATTNRLACNHRQVRTCFKHLSEHYTKFKSKLYLVFNLIDQLDAGQ